MYTGRTAAYNQWTMALLNAQNRRFLTAVAKLLYANPFLPGVVTYEREALGADAVEEGPLWSFDVSDPDRLRVNSWRVIERLGPLLRDLRSKIESANAAESELALYEDSLVFYFYYRYYDRLIPATFNKGKASWNYFREFKSEWHFFFDVTGVSLPLASQAAHFFACYHQVARAFHNIFEQIIGSSSPAARLRAAVWQSIFTHDVRRYRSSLYPRMNEFATLITGPSGTGKELIARAIALSRYIPFDESRLTFEEDANDLFFPINIAALPSTLVESELFGHKRGAFTGAVQGRQGYLGACPPLGAVFLDEIGDLGAEIQVKLLRVIETRSFQVLGESSAKTQRFQGKLIAATNRDLAGAMRKGTFREDLYYRLCSDQIRTPSLRQQIDESPGVLRDLILFMSKRVAGPAAETLAADAEHWITTQLDPAYSWPGNYRELEQCVRNILIRREYQAPKMQARSRVQDIFADAANGNLTADQLLRRYCTLIYSKTASYEETARRLKLDRRTVKAKVDLELLAKLTAKQAPLTRRV